MNPVVIAVIFAGGLFLGMLLMLEIGRRIGRRRLTEDPESSRLGTGAVEGAVFGLLGLLIAFTFSGAAERFDRRRELIVEEANDIGTAWLRIDVLPAESQPMLRDSFRRYLDARLSAYGSLHDIDVATRELARSNELQNEIWDRAVEASASAPDQRAAVLLLPALNEMIDVTTTRLMATRVHPPKIIHVMLCLLALTSALLGGYAMAGSRRRSLVHVVVFAAIVALTVYVIVDIEYPRFGLVRVDDFDRVLVELRASMK
jgi:hypothetical protein